MKKHLFFLILLVAGYMANAQIVIYEHQFETPEGNGFETGWTNIPTPAGGSSWTREPHWHTDMIANMHGLGRYARILAHSTVAHDAWLITPEISLTQGKLYQISFLLFNAGMYSVYEKLQLKIGTSPTPAGLSTLLFETANQDYYKITITADFTPTTTGNYYLGWYACSPPDGNFIMIDNVLVVEVSGNDLENVTKYQYSQVPVSQTLPSGKVTNIGAATQTNVKLTAAINGTPVGTSAPLASLAPGATAELPLLSPVYVPAGSNTMVYTISQDQPDSNPENNVATFNYKGTQNVLAIDEVTEIEFVPPVIHSEMTAFGNIFHISQPVTLSQVMIGFGALAPLDFSISLYTMTNEITTAGTPIFTQPITRTGTGFFVFNIPATTLTPGDYFLCANILGPGYEYQPYIAFDGNPAKQSYGRTDSGNLIKTWQYGGAAIRMVMTVANCADPTTLSVVPNYTWATFSWQGNAALYKLVLDDGTESKIYFTPNNNITVWNLPESTSYTWNLTAICDNTHNSATITGPPFSTLTCGTAGFSMPFFESFEGPVFPPSCWRIYNVDGNPPQWEITSSNPHTGKYSARHTENIIVAKEGWLVMPQIKIPSTENYVLEFWSRNEWAEYHRYNGVWISTTSGDPTTSTFAELKELKGSEVNVNWQKITVPLSSAGYAGKEVYIGFKYASHEGDDGDSWYIDDVGIVEFAGTVDGELAAIVSPNTGDGFTSSEAVKVLIRNNGSAPLTGFSLKLEHNGATIATETFTASIPSLFQSEYTFNAKSDLSALGAHELKVTLEIAGDIVPENNTKTKTIGSFSSKNVKLYGNRTSSLKNPYSDGFVSFSSNAPANLLEVSDYNPTDPANALIAGEYFDGYYYAYPSSFIENYGYIPVSFVKISTETWTEVSSVPVSDNVLDMAYDNTTNTMYGVIAPNSLGSILYKINLETGEKTEVANLGGKATGTLACSPQGVLYMIDSKADFYSINKTTGAITFISSIGFDLWYKQSLAFDQNTGRLFWAMVNYDNESKLIEIDPISGIIFDRGTIGDNTGIVGLYTVSGEVGISDTKIPAAFNIYPNPASDILKIVRSSNEKVQIEIYNTLGVKIKTLEISDLVDEIDVSGLSSGVYLIRLTGNDINSVQRFIKQ